MNELYSSRQRTQAVLSTSRETGRNDEAVFCSELHSVEDDRARWADKFFDRLQRDVHSIVSQSQTDDSRATIAILDTGINAQHPEMEQYIKDGIIIRYQGFPSTLDPLADKDGHGTHGTSVLHKTAPHAAVLIARVADDNRKIHDVGEVAEAIKWAVQQNADIISISWGFWRDIPIIAEALSDAHNQGILIFASASNSGANDPISFPANLPFVFCIGAADGMGYAANFTSHKYGVEKFTALGVAVEGANGRFGDDETQSLNVRKSGTSTAAPVASGIAAIFVEYTQQFLIARE